MYGCNPEPSRPWVTPLLQAFARLSAVYGGTYMLAKPDAKVNYDDAGNAVSVTSEGETVKAKIIVGDPSAPLPCMQNLYSMATRLEI